MTVAAVAVSILQLAFAAPAQHAGHGVTAQPVSPHAVRALLRTEPAKVSAGKPALLVIDPRDERGKPAGTMRLVHEKPMHLIVVSEDLSEFAHLHPAPQQDGSFRASHTFPHGGAYTLFAEFTPERGGHTVVPLGLSVAGPARRSARLVPSSGASFTSTAGGVSVTMTPGNPLRAGRDATLTLAFRDAKTGAPAADLEPYLGEPVHVVIVSGDRKDFLHAHSAGSDAADEHEGHMMPGREKSAETAVMVAFPRGGVYKIWAQFQRAGRVLTAEFVIRVAG